MDLIINFNKTQAELAIKKQEETGQVGPKASKASGGKKKRPLSDVNWVI